MVPTGQEAGWIPEPALKQVRCKFLPAHAMKAYRGNRGITPLILNLGAKFRWMVTPSRPGSFTPGKEPSYPLCWPQSQFGWFGDEQNLSCPCPDTNPGPYSPYTDYAIPVSRSWRSGEEKSPPPPGNSCFPRFCTRVIIPNKLSAMLQCCNLSACVYESEHTPF
jgi:hypothetical protein